MFAIKEETPDFRYRVRARGLADWRDFKTVRLGISVGQPYHEGLKFEATCDWAEKNFDRVVFIVGDTVQHYNHIINGMSEDQAYRRAKIEGDLWLSRNAGALNRRKFEITHWDEWKDVPEFFQTRVECGDLLKTHNDFRQEIQKCIDSAFERRGLPSSQKQSFARQSLKYLLEETAVFAVAYNRIRGISAYPGTFMGLWSIFVGNNVPGAPEGLQYGHWTRLFFEKRSTNSQHT